MKALILLQTNPGSEESAYERLKDIRATGINIAEMRHCYGRFDGWVLCEAPDLSTLNILAESLRRAGTFRTETLIEIS